jgi:phytoene synthase
MDLEQDRYLDFEGLRLYCHRVAGVVGELAAGIFGATDPATREYADRLGLAFQLTNIIRDVGEDARKGRIYLPIEDLQRFEVPAHEILAAKHSERFVQLMRFQADRAREHYRGALAGLPHADMRSQRPGLIMAAIYATLLEEIERDGFQVLSQRTSLTPVRKLWLAWRTWMRGRPPAIPQPVGVDLR